MRLLLLLTFVLGLVPTAPAQETMDKREAAVRKAMEKGRFRKALNLTERALGRKDADPVFHLLRADALMATASHEEALRQVDAYVEVRPIDGAALHRSGLAYLGLGRADSAEAHLRRSLAMQDDHEVRSHLARALRTQGRHDEAVSEYDAIISSGGGSARIHRERGGARAMASDTAGMRADLDRAIEMDPDDPVNWNSRGFHAFAQQGDHLRAIADYDQAIKLDPNYGYAFNNRGWSYHKLGDTGRALKNVRLAGRKQRSNPYVYRNLGMMAMERGDKQAACTNFRKALELGITQLHGDDVEALASEHCSGTVPKERAAPDPAPAVNAPSQPRQKERPRQNAP